MSERKYKKIGVTLQIKELECNNYIKWINRMVSNDLS